MATLKKLMTILNKEGLTEQRGEIITGFTNGRTDSARQLTATEIDELCGVLEGNPTIALDKKRKRLIAAIFGMFEKMNKQVSMDYVKGIACQAAKVKTFNSIPSTRLDSIYNAFLKAQKDLTFANRIVQNYIDEQTSYN